MRVLHSATVVHADGRPLTSTSIDPLTDAGPVGRLTTGWTAASPARLTRIRRRLLTWATATDLRSGQIDALVLASYEALANVVDHAYGTLPPLRPDLLLEAEVAGDHVTVAVSDHGRWEQPAARPGARGHGLILMRKLSDDLSIRTTATATGTVVRMCWHL
ncbi:ATP-binding protein [Fodinicola feengrottensis]|uniref:ATP-binding protein n=1 Tax=Fodinicola feengrottensis TaxID=435914 RepID=UPI0013D18116|nr:ATP-binding protein [Fodinicola feengrottensis]